MTKTVAFGKIPQRADVWCESAESIPCVKITSELRPRNEKSKVRREPDVKVGAYC